MIAGALAGSATVLITNPIWVINTRMTARQSPSEKNELPTLENPSTRKPTTLGTFLSLIRTEGPQALFAGVLPALVLVINPILQYTIFEQLKDLLEKRRKIKPLDAFFLGAIGKLLATSITYPYITIKSRMHVANSNEGETDGMGQSLKKVIKDEGWSGLYKGIRKLMRMGMSYRTQLILILFLGIGPKVTQSVVTAAFLFAFKDVLYDLSIKARRKIPA